MQCIIFVSCALLFCTYIFHFGVGTILTDGFEVVIENWGFPWPIFNINMSYLKQTKISGKELHVKSL